MALSRKMVVFERAKIDGRRVKLEREPETGRVYGIKGFLSGPLDGAPEEAAVEFLDANRRLFKSKVSTVRELRVDKVSRSPAGYHVTFQQVHQGVRVEEARVSVHMTPDKRVHAAYSRLNPQVSRLDVKRMAKDGIDQDEATRIAVDHVEATESLAESPRAELVILGQKEPRLAWRVQFATEELAEDWIVWVDALSGKVLRQREVSME